MPVYFVAANDRVKIGVASNVGERIRTLQTANPIRLRLLAVTEEGNRRTERMLHCRFADDRIHLEWLRLSPRIKEYVEYLNSR